MISYYLPFYLFKNARFYGRRFDPDQSYEGAVLTFTRSVAVEVAGVQIFFAVTFLSRIWTLLVP